MDYPAGSGSTMVRIADLNGDGRSDLAVANFRTNSLSVLLGNGDGTLKAKTDYASGTQPHSIAAGDLNKDGRTDLVAANTGATNVVVLLGNGDGTFKEQVAYPSGRSPDQVVHTDLNGDGHLDVAVSHRGEAKVGVLLGNGDGTLQAMKSFPTEVTTTTLLTGDINRDGHPDIAVHNYGNDRVDVLLADPSMSDDFADGNADGWLRYDPLAALGIPPATFEVKDGAYRIQAPAKAGVLSPQNPPRAGAIFPTNTTFADFEVAADIVDWDETADTNVGLLGRVRNLGLGRSEGYFFVHQPNLKRMHISIVRGEACLLLGQTPVTLDPTHKYRMVFRGVGEFFTGQVFDLADPGIPIVTLLARDSAFPDGLCAMMCFSATGDKAADATFDNYTAGPARMTEPVLNIGPAPALGFVSSGAYPTGNGSSAITTGDFNGDGKPDLATANYAGRNLSVLLGKGDGTFQPRVNVSAVTNSLEMVVADFNGDQKADLAVANQANASVSVLRGKGDGTFEGKVDYVVGPGPANLVGADLNGDGIVDLVSANAGTSAPDDSTLSVLLGKPDGTFADRVDYPAGDTHSSFPALKAADVNQDGKRDLVVEDTSGVRVWLGRGDGTFTEGPRSALPGFTYGLALGDFNRDGNLDAAVSSFDKDAVYLLQGGGDGRFTLARTIVTLRPVTLIALDFDGDEKLDLAVVNSPTFIQSHNQAAQRVTVFRGLGNGEFETSGTAVRGGGFFQRLASADFNGDLRPDLAVGNSADFWVDVFLNQGPTLGSAQGLEVSWPTSTPGFNLQSAGDLSGPWTKVSQAPQASTGPVQAVQAEKEGSARFFRLSK